MRSDSKLVWVRLNFRVNDLEFEDALMRPCEEDPADVQLVVEHRFLGLFALHEEFVLEVRETDGSATWRRVKLEELKFVFLEASRKVGATDTEDERARGRWLVATPSGRETTNKHLARIPVEGDAGHIERAKEALFCGGVRYQIVGGIGSRGHYLGTRHFPGVPAVTCDNPTPQCGISAELQLQIRSV